MRRGLFRRRTPLVVGLAAVAFSVGCRADGEFVRRFEAERARWRLDREEAELRAGKDDLDPAVASTLRGRHAAIERRFGATAPPAAAALENRDTLLRYRIAGASALYRADLGARFASGEEALQEYSRIAHVYGFDHELAYRARLGEGRMREQAGDLAGALESFEAVLAIRPALKTDEHSPASGSRVNRFSLHLEIYCLLLTRETSDTARFGARLAQAEEQMQARIEQLEDDPSAFILRERLAEILFIDERWEEGLSLLAEVADESSRGGERAALLLRLGDIRHEVQEDLARAEEELRLAIFEGERTRVASAARLRLAELLLDSSRPAEALKLVEEVLRFSAREVEAWLAAALFTKAHCLKELDRWEDALPVLAGVAEADPESALGLVAMEEMVRRLRSLFTPEAAVGAARDAVLAATRVPAPTLSIEPDLSWEAWRRVKVEREQWRQGVAFLRAIEQWWPQASFADAALEQASRLAGERVRDAELAQEIRRELAERRSRIAQD